MKHLLRSLIDYSGSISQDNLVINFQKVVLSQFEWDRPDDQRIYDFIKDYFQRRMELPAAGTIAHYFAALKDVEIEERLKDIASAEPFVRTNFAYLLDNAVAERMRHKAVQLLKEAQEIITKGLDIEGDRKFGVRDGLTHFASRANDLIIPDQNAKTAGNILSDGQQVWDDYIRAKSDKSRMWGKFTGLNDIDKVCHGIKKGELWIHAAFPGELKTTFALNWAYNLVTRYRTNVLYWSFEMPYEQIRLQLFVLHSSNQIWREKGYKPLDYRKVRDGMLSPEEEAFFQEVIHDFNNNPDYCALEVRSPDHEVTMDDIKLESELLNKQKELGLIILDHGQLVEARKKKRNVNYTVELNSVIRDAKKLALHFDHGNKIPVLMLFQINRDGKDAADKEGGKYKMRALTYANEAEKSADVISTTYLNEEHRKKGTTFICNLKNRDNPQFEPFLASVNLSCRRIYNITSYDSATRGMSVEEHNSQLQDLLNV